jgi:hypothetical protein
VLKEASTADYKRQTITFAAEPGDRVPFDFYELIAALAPRAFFTNSPLRDDNFDVQGVKKAMAAAAAVYALYGAEDRLTAEYPDAGHDFPDAQREAAIGSWTGI